MGSSTSLGTTMPCPWALELPKMGVTRIAKDLDLNPGTLAESGPAMRVHLSIGQRLPMYIAVLGRCISGALRVVPSEIRASRGIAMDESPTVETYMSEKKSGANAAQSITATTCLLAQTAAAETCLID